MAQTENGLNNPDGAEAEEQAPPPPSFSKDNLIPLNMPPHISVKIRVDPETVAVGGDGVVRQR